MNNILEKYANLLVNYCVSLKPGERLYVASTTLAQPLLKEVYQAGLEAGGHIEIDMDWSGKRNTLYKYANDEQLQYQPVLYKKAMLEFDAYIHIRAPFNLREGAAVDPKKSSVRSKAMSDLHEAYFKRTATLDLKRNLCQYPTHASAQNAGMALEDYEQFIFNACKLYEDDPIAAWKQLSKNQQQIVDKLNSTNFVKYKGDGIDISFSTEGRTWINSDGQTNMPSGEVYTSPVEDSVNGTIRFDYPAIYMGHEVEGVTLWVEDGEVKKWEAKRGKDFLDRIFEMRGARRFGEAAIGTNYGIDRFTKNILFDEKIGGTVHMAIGQSYLQAGGKNESAIHWDMIAGMKNGGEILVDGEKIYENGYFIGVDL